MLPHHLIKHKLINLINRTFIRKNTQYLACNEECAFFTSDEYNNHNSWSCQKVCDALVYLLDNIFIRFVTKLYRQTIGIPMVSLSLHTSNKEVNHNVRSIMIREKKEVATERNVLVWYAKGHTLVGSLNVFVNLVASLNS